MSSPSVSAISPVSNVPSAVDARAVKLHKAASEFESLLVKQMLKQSKIAGDENGNGYADMAVDAMASAVEKGGGFGLVRRIEAAIGPMSGSPHATNGTPKS
jgi:Rod binding domain-containing protein